MAEALVATIGMPGVMTEGREWQSGTAKLAQMQTLAGYVPKLSFWTESPEMKRDKGIFLSGTRAHAPMSTFECVPKGNQTRGSCDV